MQPTRNNQMQVYRYVLEHQGQYYFEYSEVQTLIVDPPVPPNLNPALPQKSLLSFELILIMFLLLLVPMLIFLAYHYGKKRGKKEKIDYSENNINSPRYSVKSNEILQKLELIQRQSTKDTSSYSNEEEKGLDAIEKHQNNSVDYKEEIENVRKNTLQNESQHDSPLLITDASKPSKDLKSTESEDSSKGSEENKLILYNPNNAQINLSEFNLTVKQSFDRDSHPDETLSPELCQETIKLHTDEDQVKKKEVEFGVTFNNKNGFLQKIETIIKTTIYSQDAKDAEENAIKLQQAAKEFNNGSLDTTPFKGLIRAQSKPQSMHVVVPEKLSKIVVTPYIDDVNAGFCYNGPIAELSSEKNQTRLEVPSKVVPQSPSALKLQNLLENDDFPHETGKFNKIFKNAEVVGEGSFGEVYKVIHKLDGKIYAVKKVKLRLGKLEDLQEKNKVFREVFAMTDLHHPNIVRYSTCWVELEVNKEKSNKAIEQSQHEKIKESKWESLDDFEEDLEEEEEDIEQSRKELSRSRARSSVSGFAWDVQDENELSHKENLTLRRTKSEKKPSRMVIRSLSRTLLSKELEASSSMSNTSATAYADVFNGINLYLFIQMEFCSGENLRNYLDSPARACCQKKTLNMFRKLVEGVDIIHKRGILHRDLKPANIFLDGSENIKIGDFGLASLDYTEENKGDRISENMRKSDRCLSMKIGTPMYTSPEQESGGRYNQKTDIFSLGLILFEMLEFFPTQHQRYQFFNKLRREHNLPDHFKEKFPVESELILRMTKRNPEERPSTEELMIEIEKLLELYKQKENFGPRTVSQLD